jgi:hypothetical protein
MVFEVCPRGPPGNPRLCLAERATDDAQDAGRVIAGRSKVGSPTSICRNLRLSRVAIASLLLAALACSPSAKRAGTGGDGSAAGEDADGAGAGGSADGKEPPESADAADAADVADAAGASPLVLSDLVIEANPNSVLSAYVSWTTSLPATSVVQFGEDEYRFEIADPNQSSVTSHRVLVIGMRAERPYRIKAISTGSIGSASAEGSFTTGSLPPQVPIATVSVHDQARSLAGWTLMNTQKGNGTAIAYSDYPGGVVMFDGEGQPVWYYVNGTNPENGGAVSTELTDKGVLIGPATRETPKEVDFAGNILWQCTDPNCGGGSSGRSGQSVSHHASKLSNGNYLLIRWVGAGTVVMPVFEEQDSQNRVVWSLDLGAFVTPPPGVWRDWCHGNSVTVDLDKDEVYASCRWLGLFKLTRSDPALKWWLPASWGAAGMGDMTFAPATSQFSDVHDPEIHADGTMLFYDNGGYDGVLDEEGNPNGYHSRVIEYAVDQTEKTATPTWEFPGEFSVDPWYRDTWYCPFWGDADRLPNGNYLITAGIRGPNSQSRVFEVTKDGQVVWEFKLPLDFGVYRSERVSPPPLVRAL